MTARWIASLERRLGFLAVPNLALFLAGMNAFSAALTLIKPEFPAQLELEPLLVMQGQVWRVLTFVFVPPMFGPLGTILWLLMYFSFVNALEALWGDAKLTLYVLIGALATAAASLIFQIPLGSYYFVVSLFLAFARLNPDTEILLFFVIPVKMRWLAWLAAFLAFWSFLMGGSVAQLAVVSGLLNYALYFGGEHFFELKQEWRRRRFGR